MLRLDEQVIKENGMELKVNLLRFQDISEDMIRQWNDLEMRGVDGNAYLSPNFILPGIKYLTPGSTPLFLTVTKISDSKRILIGLGIFEYCVGTKQFPFPHLKVYRTPHSFLSRLLIDDEYIQASINAIFKFIKNMHYIFGVELFDIIENTELYLQINIAASHLGMPYYIYKRKERSILIPRNIDDNYLQDKLSNKKIRSFRKEYKYLSGLGTVKWEIVSGRKVDENVVNRFMQLEHMGWKRKERTSLLSNPDDEIFFREMVGNFIRDDRVFFSELTVNDKIISSTVNFKSLNAIYSFKIGWDPEFAKGCPGKINDFELMRNVNKLFGKFNYIDSGAVEGSYLDELWPDRYTLRSGIFATKRVVIPVMGIANVIRKLKKVI